MSLCGNPSRPSLKVHQSPIVEFRPEDGVGGGGVGGDEGMTPSDGFSSTSNYPFRSASCRSVTRPASPTSAQDQGLDLPPVPVEYTVGVHGGAAAVPWRVSHRSSTGSSPVRKGFFQHQRGKSTTDLPLAHGIPASEYAKRGGHSKGPSILESMVVKLLLFMLGVVAVYYLLANGSPYWALSDSPLLGSRGTYHQVDKPVIDQDVLLSPSRNAMADSQVDPFPPPPPRTYRPLRVTPLSPARELLALQSYLIEDERHAIDPLVDVSKPLNPAALLGFDPRDEASWKELQHETDPLVVWNFADA